MKQRNDTYTLIVPGKMRLEQPMTISQLTDAIAIVIEEDTYSDMISLIVKVHKEYRDEEDYSDSGNA